MKAMQLMKRGMLVMLVITCLVILYSVLKTPEYLTIPHNRLKQIASNLRARFSSQAKFQPCQFSLNRTEKQVLVCFENLAREIVKRQSQIKTRPRPKASIENVPANHRKKSQRVLLSDQLASLLDEMGSKGIHMDRNLTEVLKKLQRGPEESVWRGKRGYEALGPLLFYDLSQDTVGSSVSRKLPLQKPQSHKLSDLKKMILGDGYQTGPWRTDGDLSHGNRVLIGYDKQTNPVTAELPNVYPFSSRGYLQRPLLTSKTEPAVDMSMAKVEKRFEQRRMTLQTACQKFGNWSVLHNSKFKPIVLPAFPPVTNKSVSYCPIQKTGSTTWTKLLLQIRKNLTVITGGKKNSIKGTINEEWLKNTSRPDLNGTSFLFVREPYSRLLSAYVDKLFSPNTVFWSGTGRHIVRTFRTDASQLSLVCGHDVTFPEFIRYVIHAQKTSVHRDGHFTFLSDHCNLCQQNYHYIGHLETLHQDMPYLLKVFHFPVNYTARFEEETLTNNANMVFQRMSSEIQDCISLDQAGRRLWRKWQIRGLVSKVEQYPFGPLEAANVRRDSIVAAALQAVHRSGGMLDLKGQKQEALREAYASVPLSLRLDLKKLLFLDFKLFGFDPEPDTVFPKTKFIKKDDFSYFRL